MAKRRDGSSAIITAARRIRKMKAVYKATNLTERTSGAFASAVGQLIAALDVWEATDDYPGQVDRSMPFSAEDNPSGL